MSYDIGTKIATQVLHDGGLVEMDAEKGIVRVIKKAKNDKQEFSAEAEKS